MVSHARLVLVPALMGVLSISFFGCTRGGGGKPAVLDPPSGVTATAGLQEVTVDWLPVGGATSFNLYWATSPGVTKTTGNLISGVIAPYTHTGLAIGTTYYYVVTSLIGVGEGVESAEVSATPTGPPPPTGLTAVPGDMLIRLSWVPVPGATHNLYFATTPGVTAATGTLQAGVISPMVHINLTNGVTYYYVLTTVIGAIEGPESAEVSATPLPSAMGVLDTSFGGVGWVSHHNAAGGDGADHGRAITVDGSGRILVAGSSIAPPNSFDIVVWRYSPDGSLDTTFNGQGWVTHDGAAGGASWDEPFRIATDASDRIVLAGCSENASGDADMAIWRFNPDGTLDTTFGGQGFVTHGDAAGGASDDFAYGLALEPSGHILATGASVKSSGNSDMVIWRYDATGTLDPGFGTGGIVIHADAAGGGGDDGGLSITLDASGRILVSGFSLRPSLDVDLVLWRYDSTGALDTTFGAGGFVMHDAAAGANGDDYGCGIAVEPGGRIIIAGSSVSPLADEDMVVWAFDSNGVLDPGFGTGGIFTHNDAAGGNSFDYAFGVVLGPSGRIIASGRSYNSAGNFDLAIWALDFGGALDPSFGTGGIVVHDNAAGGFGWDQGDSIAMDALGRILVAGESRSPADGDMTIWRFQ